MLGLGIGSYNTQYPGGWLPSDESSLEAWYQNKVGITTETGVSQWADQSGNGHHMVQADTGEQPAYNSDSGALTFDPSSDTQNLAFAGGASPSNITLDAAFVIGIKMNPAAVSTVVLGSNALANEMFKLQTGSIMRLKNDSAGNKDFTLDSGDTKDDAYWVIVRDGSNNTTIYKDGVANPSSSVSVTGTFDINAIGVRRTDLNPFDGTVKEVVIFKGDSSTSLIRDLNDRLSKL
tara:strand:+ start:406 stop:1107 length:702 start_codon:yes stop_codon:yes gene_type:complete